MHADEIIVETPRKPGLEWPAELAAYTKPDGSSVRLPVTFLQLGDTAIWSAPVEMFCEIAIYVRDHSPFTNTYFGYTNGWIGYLPTAEAFVEGGYEPKTSVFTGAAEQDVKDAVATHLHSLRH